MTSYVNKDTNFSNIIINNGYRCVVGGTWTAKLVNGVTMYVNNSDATQIYEGPINFIGIASLTISSGAVADNIVVIQGSSTTPPTISISSGGILSNSTIFTSSITVSAGGTSEGNSYVSSTFSLSAGTVDTATNITTTQGGVSINDSTYFPSVTGTSSGTLEQSDGTFTSFQTSTGNGSNSLSTASSMDNPNIYGNGSATGTNTITLSSASYIGDKTIAANKPVDQYTTISAYTISNNYTIGTANDTSTTWTATLVNGVTVLTSAAGSTFTGPLNLINITSLTIKEGAVVDGLFLLAAGSTLTYATITIDVGGTLQNSFVTGATINNSGTSLNNTYISPIYTGESGSISKGDYMLQPGVMQYNLSLPPQKVNLNYGISYNQACSVTLNGTASFDSYIEKTASSSGSPNKSTMIFSSSSQATIGCFLAGTLINTTNGLIAVENIKVNDQIIAYVDGKEVIRSVIWTGHNTVTVNNYTNKEGANYPIRILKNAISDDVPFKDLLVTPEHCIMLDGQFIPARMLVNGSSIFYDTTFTEYTYYHIETEEHSIITADGVLTESYLDTGNRAGFISDENIVSIVKHNKKWNIDSAAPLVTTREVVEPIFMRLTQRLPELGLEPYKTDLLTTNDSGLYLLTDNRKVIHSRQQNNNRFIFAVPADVKQVQLISRTTRPSQAIGAFIDDRRDLGVLVGKITLLEKNKTYYITEHFTSKSLQGWDVQEQGNYRWTNGHGILNIRSNNSNNATSLLVIEVLSAGPYLLEENSSEHKVA